MSLTVSVLQFHGGVTAYHNPTARGVGNYLHWICGKFAIEGQYIITGIGGGSVIPINPGATPNPLNFIVSPTSFIADGQSTVSIPSYIGYNLLFVRNNIPQSTINTESSYYTWNKTNGQFTCFGAAYTSEVFQLYPFI